MFLIAILALGLLELRRDRGVGVALLGGVGIVALLFVPLTTVTMNTEPAARPAIRNGNMPMKADSLLER